MNLGEFFGEFFRLAAPRFHSGVTSGSPPGSRPTWRSPAQGRLGYCSPPGFRLGSLTRRAWCHPGEKGRLFCSAIAAGRPGCREVTLEGAEELGRVAGH